MAKTDFFVIAYRILCYLYDCLQKGITPDMNVVSYEKLGIPEKYWLDVLKMLLNDGYIKGISIETALGGQIYTNFSDPAITIAGIGFLQENSAMGKAKAFLKGLKETIPGL